MNDNLKMRKELVDFQILKECTEVIQIFVCRCYSYRSNKDSLKRVGKIASLDSTEYTLFTKKRLEREKLPLTKDAFGFHLSRAFISSQYGIQHLI